MSFTHDVRAQFLRNHGWPSRPDMVEGLEVGRKLVALGRCCLVIFRGEHLTDDLIAVA